jgi:hypothetical protein
MAAAPAAKPRSPLERGHMRTQYTFSGMDFCSLPRRGRRCELRLLALVDVILLPPYALVAVQLIFTQTNAILIHFLKSTMLSKWLAAIYGVSVVYVVACSVHLLNLELV